MTSILLSGAGRQARPCAACLRISPNTTTTTKPSGHTWVRQVSRMTGRHKAAGRIWEQLAEERKKTSRVAWDKEVGIVQERKERWVEKDHEQIRRARNKMRIEEKWGPPVPMSGEASPELYKMAPTISPGIIPSLDMRLSEKWEQVPARLGKCIHFGCTTPEQIKLMNDVNRVWGAKWLDVLAGLNHTVLGVDWKPPMSWLKARGDDYLPTRIGLESDEVLDKEFTESVPSHGRTAPADAGPIIKYHLWTKPFLPTMRYKGERWVRDTGYVEKALVPGSIETIMTYKNRWLRTWLPHSAGVTSRSPPSRLRALVITPGLLRPMTYRLSSSILVDASWGELYQNLPTDIDDHLAWDKLSRHIRSLQKEWVHGSPDLEEKVKMPQQMPFLSLTVAYSMQDQRIMARSLHENPSVNDAPLTRNEVRVHSSKWEYVLAQFFLYRDMINSNGHDGNTADRYPWHDPYEGPSIVRVLDKAIPLLHEGLAQAAELPDKWDANGDHPAIAPAAQILVKDMSTRALLQRLMRSALNTYKTELNITYRYSLKYQRLRMQAVAKRVLYRLAVQEEAADWARQTAKTTMKSLRALEEMTWKREGAVEMTGV